MKKNRRLLFGSVWLLVLYIYMVQTTVCHADAYCIKIEFEDTSDEPVPENDIAEIIYVNHEANFELPILSENKYYYECSVIEEEEEIFEDWNKIEGTNFVLYPTQEINECLKIKFRKVESESGFIRGECTYSVHFDFEKPQLEFNASESIGEWQNSDIACQLHIKEEECLKSITCYVGNELLYEKSYSISDNAKAEDIDFILSEETPADGTPIKIYVYDQADNESTFEEIYYIDKKAPRISTVGIENGAKYKAGQQIQVLVEEEIYQYAEMSVEIVKSYEEKLQQEKSTVLLTEFNTVFKKDFNDEGDYEVVVFAYDKAGNVSETIKLHYRIDLTAPVILLSGISNGSYFCIAQDLHINVKEAFYKDEKVFISATKEIAGDKQKFAIKSWENSATEAESIETFDEDGIYMISVQAEDASGNKAEAREICFAIDRVAPVIDISGIADGDAVKTAPILTFSVRELFYDTNHVEVVIKTKNANEEVEYNIIPYSCNAVDSHADYAIKEEGDYEIYIKSSDRAGNISMGKKQFIFDKTPPMIDCLNKIDQQYLDFFQLTDEFEKLISDKSLFSYRVYINGELYKENRKITKEGKYIIEVIATDEAGNISSESAEFMIGAKPTYIDEERIPLTKKKKMKAAVIKDSVSESKIKDSVSNNDVLVSRLSIFEKILVLDQKVKVGIVLGIILIISVLILVLRHIDRDNTV